MKTRRITGRALIALLISCLIGIGLASQAQASAPVLLSGSAWLNGQGVNVCDGSTDPNCGSEAHVGGVSSNWWQCVELAQRLYQKLNWHTGSFGVSYAYQIYDQALTIGMSRQANGSITSIYPGDMIIHGSDAPYSGGAGHVSVVDYVSGSTVYVVEQNTYNDQPRATYSFTNGTLSRSGSGTLRGVVHDPANTLTVPAPLPSAPVSGSLTVNFNNSLHVFGRGVNQEIYRNVWSNNSWSGFWNIGPGFKFLGDPVAVEFSGKLHVFARGTDKQIYRNTLKPDGWTGFTVMQQGAVFDSNPVVAQHGSSLGIFAIGIDRQMYNNSWDGTGWTGFTNVQAGAYFVGKPEVVNFNGQLHVFGRGIDDHIYRNVWNGSWTGFWDIAPGFAWASNPVASWHGSSLGVFVIGSDGQMYNNSWSTSGWTGFSVVQTGAYFTGNPEVVNFSGELHVFGRGVDNQIYRNVWNGSWTGFWNIGPGSTFKSDPIAGQHGSSLGIFAVGVDDQMYNNSWSTSGWTGFSVVQSGALFVSSP